MVHNKHSKYAKYVSEKLDSSDIIYYLAFTVAVKNIWTL